MMHAMEAKMAHVKANLKLRFFLGSMASESSAEAIVDAPVLVRCLLLFQRLSWDLGVLY
jgi:hypothetical protein